MPQRSTILGLDIGGANLKAALPTGEARTVSFALWKSPPELPQRLREVLDAFPHDALAITMTGELCDCFASRSEGVHAILDAVAAAAPQTPVSVWNCFGKFCSVAEARAHPWTVASANWLALATFAGRFAPEGNALVIDVGSTTTDMTPLQHGKPIPHGLADRDRLATGLLVYSGVRRTPVCAILGMSVAAELFATTFDVYLLLDMIPEEPDNCDTADGRPATKHWASARLARMWCDDGWRPSQAAEFAQKIHHQQVHGLRQAIQGEGLASWRLMGANQDPQAALWMPQCAVIAGSGEFLARKVARAVLPADTCILSLREHLSEGVSTAACAYAVATLASER